MNKLSQVSGPTIQTISQLSQNKMKKWATKGKMNKYDKNGKKKYFESDFMINELDESMEDGRSPLDTMSKAVSLSDKVSTVIENNQKKETWRDKFEVFKMMYTIPILLACNYGVTLGSFPSLCFKLGVYFFLFKFFQDFLYITVKIDTKFRIFS